MLFLADNIVSNNGVSHMVIFNLNMYYRSQWHTYTFLTSILSKCFYYIFLNSWYIILRPVSNVEHIKFDEYYIRHLLIVVLHGTEYYISYVASKISKSIGIIAKLRHFVPRNTLFFILLFFHIYHMVSLYGVRLPKFISIKF